MFVGRKKELQELEKEYKKGKFVLSVIYGRRRVGKTYFIKEFIKDKIGEYFVSVDSNEIINLELISKAVYKACGNLTNLPVFSDFEKALRFLFEYSLKNQIVFVIDEYPYIAESSPYISSVIQNLIDEYREKSKLFLILCGSSMSFMEEQVLGYKSPLYGRRTNQIKINPFNYLESSEFVNNFNEKEKAIVFGLTNGVAEYLSYFDDSEKLEENIVNIFFNNSGRLYEEPYNLLKQELRQPKTYNDILFAISNGASKLNEIATKTNVASGTLSHYLNSLINLGIVEKKTPVLDRKSKRPIYSISDTMFKFWYKFVQPNMSLIALDQGERLFDTIVNENLNDYMGSVFEKITIQYFEELIKRSIFSMIPKDYGNWWGTDSRIKKESEIDLLAYDNNDNYLFVEAKWNNQKVKKDVLDSLVFKSEIFDANVKEYWVTSLSGFENINISDSIKLIELKDMYNF